MIGRRKKPGPAVKVRLRAFISTMGCPKNLVDSEAAAAVLESAGCSVTPDPREADVLLVGACSFLESSWRDTVEEVERLARYKKERIKDAGNHGARSSPTLVLMGCLPVHRNEDLGRALPDVDLFLPTGAHERLADLAESWRGGSGGAPVSGRLVDGSGVDRFAAFEKRKLFTPPHTAYVKIAEGCNRRCSFCAIPAIRGRQITRPVASIVREVEGLAAAAVKEVTLLSQDIVSYRDGGSGFVDLVDEVVKTGVDWVRVFYLHPAGLTIDHIRGLFRHPSVVRYLEMPVQHASDRMLERMRRSHDRAHVERLLGQIRAEFPETVVRSEVIVGYPGETDEEFESLLRFVEEIEFDSLGVFPYSREPGTEAAESRDLVPDSVVRQRLEEITRAQEAVSFGVQARRVGETYRILVDRKCESAEEAFEFNGTGAHAGRYYGQAPEIDGEVFVASEDVEIGEFATVQITDSDIFDLKGELLTESPA